MRSIQCLLLTACAVLLLPAGAAAQAPPMTPGMWEISIAMEMPDMPVAMPSMTVNQCVTPDMLESRGDVFTQGPFTGPMNPDPDETDCAMTDYNLDGQTVTWSMACTRPQEMTAEGEMTFADDRYTGTVRSTMPQGMMTMNLDARRVGACE